MAFQQTLDAAQKLLSDINSTEYPTISKLVKIRGSKRQSLTKTLQKIANSYPQNESELTFYINKFNELKTFLVESDEKIMSLLLDANILDDNSISTINEASEIYLDDLNRYKIDLELTLKNSARESSSVNSSQTPTGGGQIQNRLKVPHIDMPEFDGKPEEYEEFITSLEEILNKFNFTQYEKLTYLRKQVSGSAKQVISSVRRSNTCFDDARSLLEKTFSDPVVQQASVIKRLLNLKLNYDNRHFWMSESTTILDQVQRLKISTDTFIEYLLWEGMDQGFKNEYISVTNKSQPNLKEIRDNIYEVFKRMESSKKMQNKNFDSITLATNVKFKPKFDFKNGCLLCQTTDEKDALSHKLDNCKLFPTADEKVKKLKEINGCLRCGLINHQTNTCKYVFREKCGFCHKDHLSSLCFSTLKSKPFAKFDKSKSNVKNSKSNPSSSHTNSMTSSFENDRVDSEVDSQVVSFSVMNNTADKNVILPTFTAKLEGCKRESRFLYDTASQLSFVSEGLLKCAKHVVLNADYKIRINGFNESKVYNTKLVKLFVNLNNFCRPIVAVVVPNIKTKVNASGLKPIVDALKQSKIPIADRFLPSKCDQIDLLLGADNIHILPTQSCVFGTESHKSLFYVCCQGVMLIGKIENLIKNLPSLSLLQNFIDKIKSTF